MIKGGMQYRLEKTNKHASKEYLEEENGLHKDIKVLASMPN